MKNSDKQDNYYAKINWDGKNPLSDQYEDYYYSKQSGIAETNYVYLEQNNLASRFTQLDKNQTFIIGETGFGSGLNFLATAVLWQKHRPNKSAKLHFISIEKHPLSPHELGEILNNFPELGNVRDELLWQYYLPLPGFHRLSFCNNIELTLIIADVIKSLPELTKSVDAWFLDGFSPTKNSEMWSIETFSQIARLSHSQTTFATFTASSMVRKNLQACGFKVNKIIGFAGKREMLSGKFEIINSPLNITKAKPKFYYEYPQNLQLPTYTNPSVAIIGAGISGAATAYSLAKRGYQVVVIEQRPTPAMEASGNYQGMLYGTWSAFGGEMMELSCAAYRYSHYLVNSLLMPEIDYANCGLIQLSHNQSQITRHQQLLQANYPRDFFHELTSVEIENKLNTKFNTKAGGLYFPYGLWLNPPSLVNKLLTHPNIKVINSCEITKFEQTNGIWSLYNEENKLILQASNLVLCNAHAVNKFEQTDTLNLRKIRGQITIAETDFNLSAVVCGDGYVTPLRNNKCTLGATFQFNDEDMSVRQSDHLENIANFESTLPDFIQLLDRDNLAGQTNFRTASHDYFPLVGPIADKTQFIQDFAKLRQDKNAYIKNHCRYLPGLYLNLAHGAKGMLTAPICGEIIADYIDNTPLPCSESLRQALHPNRIYVKDLVKNR